jgi:hypothetical protein
LSIARAFNEVKATSKAHDKQVSLNTNRNYNALQASKPWASPEDMAAAARGRGAPRGRGFRGRGGGGVGRQGNDWNPRPNNNYNSGGNEHFSPTKQFNQGRGQFNSPNKFPRNNNQQQGPPRGQNHGNQHGNQNSGFQQKQRSANKPFRGGGN